MIIDYSSCLVDALSNLPFYWGNCIKMIRFFGQEHKKNFNETHTKTKNATRYYDAHEKRLLTRMPWIYVWFKMNTRRRHQQDMGFMNIQAMGNEDESSIEGRRRIRFAV